MLAGEEVSSLLAAQLRSLVPWIGGEEDSALLAAQRSV